MYNDPDLLILDEATSALDALTEDVASSAIRKIMHEKTIIMIAHRLGTVQQADIIYLLQSGSLADQGTNEQFLDKSDKFRRLANEKFQADRNGRRHLSGHKPLRSNHGCRGTGIQAPKAGQIKPKRS